MPAAVHLPSRRNTGRCARTSGVGSILPKTHRTRGPWCLADNPAVQGHSSRPSENVPTFSENIAYARAWSNSAEARAAGAQLVSGPQVVNGLGGRHCLLSTFQRAGRGTARDGALRQWRLKVDTSIFRNVGHGVAVIFVSLEALFWVGRWVRFLSVSGEVEGEVAPDGE